MLQLDKILQSSEVHSTQSSVDLLNGAFIYKDIRDGICWLGVISVRKLTYYKFIRFQYLSLQGKNHILLLDRKSHSNP